MKVKQTAFTKLKSLLWEISNLDPLLSVLLILETDQLSSLRACLPVVSKQPKVARETFHQSDSEQILFVETIVSVDDLDLHRLSGPNQTQMEKDLSAPSSTDIDQPVGRKVANGLNVISSDQDLHGAQSFQ